MEDPALIEMLAAESNRRVPPVREGLERLAAAGETDREAVEELRAEVHGLKGAAMVVGQPELARLAERIETAIAERAGAGTIDGPLAARLDRAVAAFHEGVRAAAVGRPEPPAVAESLAALA